MDNRDDLARLLEQRRADPAFAERVRRRMAEDKAILDRLAESERSDDQAHRLALGWFSKHLVEVILAAGWVPGELLAAEQARNATLTDTIQRVRSELLRGGSSPSIRCQQALTVLDEVVVWDGAAILDGPGEEDG